MSTKHSQTKIYIVEFLTTKFLKMIEVLRNRSNSKTATWIAKVTISQMVNGAELDAPLSQLTPQGTHCPFPTPPPKRR